MSTRLKLVFDAIDLANACDPGRDDTTGEPSALLYGQRMSVRLEVFAPDAPEEVAIAVRGQHIERWTIARGTYPMDRAGYLHWRNDLKDKHATRLSEIMTAAGYDRDRIARVKQIVRKEGLRTDPHAQTLEDVACLVFLEHYAADFATKHDETKVVDIVRKTWRKMSDAGHRAAKTLVLPPAVATIVGRALAD